MIIGISGKIGSGKDTIGKIIQYLTSYKLNDTIKIKHYLEGCDICSEDATWKVKKFADKLKDIVCILLGCTREQLEDHEFKNTELGEEWTSYSYADGHNDHYRNGEWSKSMNSVPCSKEIYEEEKRINWQTAYKRVLTPRLLMQLVGTECVRRIIHPDIWVNSLMSSYIPYSTKGSQYEEVESNWIITDIRFPNELQAVKEKEGISIRVNRPPPACICNTIETENCKIKCNKDVLFEEHESESALDMAEFDYTIDNNGTIEELIEQVREILIKEKII